MASRSYEIKNVLTRDGYLARVLKFDSNSNLYTLKHFNTNTVEFLDNSQFRPFHNISNYSFAEVDYTQKCKELLRRDYEDMFQEGSMEYVNIPGSVPEDPEQGSRRGGRGRTASTRDILAYMKKATKDQQIRRGILIRPADEDDEDDGRLTGQQLEIFGGSEDESESDTSSSASSSSASSSSSSDDEGASFNFDKKSYTLMKKALKKKAKRDKLEMAMGLQIRTLSSKKPYTFRMID